MYEELLSIRNQIKDGKKNPCCTKWFKARFEPDQLFLTIYSPGSLHCYVFLLLLFLSEREKLHQFYLK